MHINKLGLSPAARACLKAAGITTVQQITTHTAAELIDSGHFGGSEIYEIVSCLNEHGLSIHTRPGTQARVRSGGIGHSLLERVARAGRRRGRRRPSRTRRTTQRAAVGPELMRPGAQFPSVGAA